MLTYNQAIRETKQLWHEIEDAGVNKGLFLMYTERGAYWSSKNYMLDCPLCEFTNGNCNQCPLIKQYSKTCVDLNYHKQTTRWYEAIYNLKRKA